VIIFHCASVPIDDGSLTMSILRSSPSQSMEFISDDLVDGDMVHSEDLEPLLVKGPKVNGGFAPNTLPLDTGDDRVTNPDCAGYMIHGKCMKPLPHHSRLATVEDNMLSPEQSTGALYETNVGQMVKQFFHQRIMEETAHPLAGMPGYAVVEEEMNKADAVPANVESDGMFPIGEGMMEANDAEVDANGHRAKMNLEDCMEGFAEDRETHPLPDELGGHHPAIRGGPWSLPTTDVDSGILRNMPRGCDGAESLTTSSGEEVAMPMQPHSTFPVVVTEEVGDLEENIPHHNYESDPEVSPSPSPSASHVPPHVVRVLPEGHVPTHPRKPPVISGYTPEYVPEDEESLQAGEAVRVVLRPTWRKKASRAELGEFQQAFTAFTTQLNGLAELEGGPANLSTSISIYSKPDLSAATFEQRFNSAQDLIHQYTLGKSIKDVLESHVTGKLAHLGPADSVEIFLTGDANAVKGFDAALLFGAAAEIYAHQ